MNAIDVVNVTKTYRKYARRKRFATLKSAILSGTLIDDLNPEDAFYALRGVSFSVRQGCTFGIVGRNGSGKSTALKVVAGITKPTTGTVSVQGRISALIELGAGFHPEISGRENVFINGIMLGLSKREVTRRFDEIVEFAELEDFIDAPVKTYSSGMYMRLGFAVAIHVDPDVLLIDEVLAVGDEGFTHKCLDKFAEFRRRNKTVLLVTHSLALVERFCDEALWLNDGRARAMGDPRRVVSAYITDVKNQEEHDVAEAEAKARAAVKAKSVAGPADTGIPDPGPRIRSAAQDASTPDSPPDMFQATEGRWGSREGEITAVQLIGADGQPGYVFSWGERVEIRLSLKAASPLTDFVVGIGIFNADNVCAFGTNTNVEELTGDRLEGEGHVAFTIDSLELAAGTYKLDVALHRLDGYPYDYHRLLYSFRVKSSTQDAGIYCPRHTWGFGGGVSVKARETGS